MNARLASAALLFSALVQANANEARFDPPNDGAYLAVGIREDGEQGPVITGVLPGGPAALAGLERDDILVGIGEWRYDPDDTALTDHLRVMRPKPTIARVLRDGAALELPIEPDRGMARTALAIAGKINSHRLFRRAEAGSLDTLTSDLRAAANQADTRERAYEAMNRVIDRFDLSHTAILTPWVVENQFGEGEHFHLGMFLQRIEKDGQHRYFVRSMMHGSPAREAGIRIGDELLAVNGVDFSKSARRTLAGYEARRNMYSIQIDRDEELALRLRRKAGAEPQTIPVKAGRALDAVDSAQRSVRLIETADGRSIGYIHFWNVMSGENIRALESALENELKAADGLAIDLRGRGGQVSVISRLSRIIGRERRPVALLIDSEARSAKEMLAYRLQNRRQVTVIGETSAGAVLPANFHDLPDGARLMLPLGLGDAVIRAFTAGARLEGIGTVPDLKVDAPLPYRAGRDPILDHAVEFLDKQVSGKLLRL